MSDNPFASPAPQDSALANFGADAPGSLGVLQPLADVAVWSKVLAVAMILFGVMFVLSIIGIVIAWLPIWSGILLWQHANSIAEARRVQDGGMLRDSIEKLATSIKVAAIFQAIIMALYALYFGIIIIAIFAGTMF